jgi:hypothetical protein
LKLEIGSSSDQHGAGEEGKAVKAKDNGNKQTKKPQRAKQTPYRFILCIDVDFAIVFRIPFQKGLHSIQPALGTTVSESGFLCKHPTARDINNNTRKRQT